jgi:hypothetical protein
MMDFKTSFFDPPIVWEKSNSPVIIVSGRIDTSFLEQFQKKIRQKKCQISAVKKDLFSIYYYY